MKALAYFKDKKGKIFTLYKSPCYVWVVCEGVFPNGEYNKPLFSAEDFTLLTMLLAKEQLVELSNKGSVSAHYLDLISNPKLPRYGNNKI